jgi:hypothetical protein
MRRLATVAVAAGLVGLAAVVTLTTPDEEDLTVPFAVRADDGETVTGRDIQARLSDPRLGEEATVGSWRGTTAGVWLSVEATVSPVVAPGIVDAQLTVGDYVFLSTSRPSTDTVTERAGEAGLPLSGVILFELPDTVAELPGADRAALTLATSSDPRLDSVIEYRIDLTALDVEPSLRLPEAQRAVW